MLQGLGVWVKGLSFRVEGSCVGSWVQCSVFSVQSEGFWVYGVRGWGLGFGVWGSEEDSSLRLMDFCITHL